MYPKEVNLFDKQSIDKSNITIHKYRELAPIKNRMEFFDTQLKVIFTDAHDKNNCVEFVFDNYIKDKFRDKKSKL